MISKPRFSTWVLTLVALALATSAPADAQQSGRVSVEGHAGIAIPARDLADLTDVGPSFGVALGYRIQPKIQLLLSGDVDRLQGVKAGAEGSPTPDLNLWHYTAGVLVNLTEPEQQLVSLDVNFGLGATTFDSDQLSVGALSGEFSETYFTLQSGVRIGYDVSTRIRAFVGGQAYLMFADEDETAELASLRSDVDPFDTSWSFPVQAGLSIRF